MRAEDENIPSCDVIGIMVVTTAVSTGTHGHDVTGLRDLIVQLGNGPNRGRTYTTEGGSHLVCKSTGDNHDISLTRTTASREGSEAYVARGIIPSLSKS